MKVFLSWSGDPSRQIAKVLSEQLQTIVPSVTTFMSSEGIEKGSRWSKDIAEELSDTNFGIICLTKGNLNSPWINFEAGALSKSIKVGKVAPLLFGVAVAELSESPLSQFQATFYNENDVKKLFEIIAKQSNDFDSNRFQKYFSKFWPDLDSEIRQILASNEETRDFENAQTPLEKNLQLVQRRLQRIEMRLGSPESLLPINHLVKSLIKGLKLPKETSALVNHIQALENIITEIDNSIFFVSDDELEQMSDAINEIRSSISGFEPYNFGESDEIPF